MCRTTAVQGLLIMGHHHTHGLQYAKLSSGDIAKVQAQYRSILLCSPLLKSAGIARLSLGKHQTAVIALSLIQ